MCIFRRIIFLIGLVGHIFIISYMMPLVENNLFMILGLLLYFFTFPIILSHFTKCPKCGTWIGYELDGTYYKQNISSIFSKDCKTCGYNTFKC